MNVTYTDKVKQSNGAELLLLRPTNDLEQVLGQSAGVVKAEWDRREEKGQTVFSLRLSDWTGAVSADFAPDELESASQMRYRLIRLWGDLLQIRSHKQLQELTAPSGQPED